MSRTLLFILLATPVLIRPASAQTIPYKLGRLASAEEISRRSISVAPDGTGLPAGHGTVREGRYIYKALCASCHGDRGQGIGDYPALVGGQGTLQGKDPVLTIGSYWPYATTVWDYTRRAMPYQRPGTLTTDETYAVTAFLLYMNGILDEKTELDEKSLPRVKMPNRDGFVPDPRPDIPAKNSDKLVAAGLPLELTAQSQATANVTLLVRDLSRASQRAIYQRVATEIDTLVAQPK